MYRTLIVLLLLWQASGAGAAPKWHVAAAPVRFSVHLDGGPTHPPAGYFVQLPDGGILPRPFPHPHVVQADGTELKSAVLWQNTGTGVGLVFQVPKRGGDVFVYVAPGRRLPVWTPASELKPSAMLCTQSGRGSKGDALALSRLGPVNHAVHYRNRAGIGKAPLSIPGDLSGRGGACAIYMLAHVATVDPGKTWVAPIAFQGGTEVRIDGRTLKIVERIKKPGGRGDWADLAKGLHRLEILCWSNQGAAPKNGFMTLTWKTPKTTEKEMGGKRPSHLKFPGTSMWESRRLHGNEIVRSGRAHVTAAASKDGGPVAWFDVAPVENFWINGPPVVICKLAAHTEGNPRDTRYVWSFGGRSNLPKPVAHWPFSGGRDHTVSLTTVSGDKRSVCSVPFYPHKLGKTDINNPQCRKNYRVAALDVFTAYPAEADPTANWTPAHWDYFFQCMELDKGRELLTHIINVRWGILSQKLSAARKSVLRDLILDFAPRVSPQLALKWIDTFDRQGGSEAGMMQVLRAETHMYYMDDVDGARKILDDMARRQQKDEASEWARIRLGDLAFMAGDLNAAMKLYGEVQNRSKHRSSRSGGPAAVPSRNPVARLKNVGLARSKAELEARRNKGEDKAATPSRGRSFALRRGGPVAEWKMNALLDVSASESVKSLVEQGYLLEAKQALRRWEREFPLSKLTGDYVINEAIFLMKLEDWKRAAALLEPYCEHVDASSFMAPAVEALLECKVQLKASDEEVLKFCEKMKKKLEFHPAGRHIEDQIRWRQ